MIRNLEKQNPEIGQSLIHASNETQVRLAKVRDAMKDYTASKQGKPAQIHAHGISQCDDDVRALMPSVDTCKHTLRNQRPTPYVLRLLQDLGELPKGFAQAVGPNPTVRQRAKL